MGGTSNSCSGVETGWGHLTDVVVWGYLTAVVG